METMCMCEVCGQLFDKDYLLLLHQRQAHITEYEQMSINIQHSSTPLNIPAFSNYGNFDSCGGGVPGGGIGREINGTVGVVGHSGTGNQHQCLTFSGSKPPVPSSLRLRRMSDHWEEKAAEFARLRQQISQPTADYEESNIVRQLNTMKLDDGMENRMGRASSSSGARACSSIDREACAVPLNIKRTTDSPINVQTASGGPQIGITQQSSILSTNYVPNGASAVPQGNKRAAGTQRQAPPLYEPSDAGAQVAHILKTLLTIKLLTNPPHNQTTIPNKNSLSRVIDKACNSVGPGSNPTVIPPSNRLEPEKEEKKKESNVKHIQAEKLVPERDHCIIHEHIVAKKSVPAPADGKSGKEEKNPILKMSLERNYRFIPSRPSRIKGNGIHDSPKQTCSAEVAPSTSSAMLTITKSVATATAVTASGAAAGHDGEVFGKTIASTFKVRGSKGKMLPHKTSPDHANGLNPAQSSAKNDKGLQRNGKSTKLAHGRVVLPTSSANTSSKKSVVAVTACVTGRAREVVARKSTASPKKPPPLPKTTKKGTGSMKVTLAKLKQIVPTMPGTDYIMPLSDVGSYTDKLGKQFWICLVCNQVEQEESSKDMICCDECDTWYHFECVGIMEDVAEDDPWFCKICIYKVCGNKKGVFPEIFMND